MSLTINMNDIAGARKPAEVKGTLDLSELFRGRKEIAGSGPLKVTARAEAGAGVVDVKGKAEAGITFVCSRCLSHYDTDLHIPIREMFTRNPDVAEADEEESIHLVQGEEADLRPVLEENVLLELPLVPLCREDCNGLCPVCGKNRNEDACGCTEERIDPRLAGLKDFFNK